MEVKPIPKVTVALFVVTAVPSVVQIGYPALEVDLRRDPDLIAAGDWWRLVTSLVVQDGGLLGTASNLAFLLILGALTERALGPLRTAALYTVGAVLGQAAGMLFHAAGAGNSIAVCGPAGGLVIAVLRGFADPVGGALAALFALLIAGTAVPSQVGAGIAIAAGRMT